MPYLGGLDIGSSSRVSAWEELAEALKFGAIVELNLAGNDIGPEGTKVPPADGGWADVDCSG